MKKLFSDAQLEELKKRRAAVSCNLSVDSGTKKYVIS
jgi:hypothetical protein